MVVEYGKDSEKGQSVVEFMLMLPMLVGVVIMLVHVNTAIQVSIVNQQYARAQALWLTFNSAWYPQLSHRETNLVPKGYNKMVLGVSDNKASDENGRYTPVATIQNVARRRGLGSDVQDTPAQRAMVRVRDTVTLCAPTVVEKKESSYVPVLPLTQASAGSKSYQATDRWAVGETYNFEFCRSPLKDE